MVRIFNNNWLSKLLQSTQVFGRSVSSFIKQDPDPFVVYARISVVPIILFIYEIDTCNCTLYSYKPWQHSDFGIWL
jgi:hypothetical protein